jgi:SAM-dependent methyltransferase
LLISSDPQPARWPRLRLAAATFAILALELTLIRWMGGQIRIFAYFANLVLLAAFLGMGLGLQLGRKHPGLVRFALPALVPLAAVLAFSPELGLVHLRFPDPSIGLWGVQGPATLQGFLTSGSIVLALFWAVVAVFLLMAAPVGQLFDQMPALEAYSADLSGSLLGVLAMTALAALGTSPVVWLAIVAVPLLWLAPRPYAFASAAAVLVLAAVSIRGAAFSPYNRLDVSPFLAKDAPFQGGQEWLVLQNRDYSQLARDLSAKATEGSPARRKSQLVYELPFLQRAAGSRALIVGAGTGNDVAAAIRLGFREIVAVEIDPRIVAIGRRLHPEHPYSNPSVKVVVTDARAYFEQNRGEKFDVVCYGLLDSHAMFSSMSSLRLENYVYTVEGLRAGWEHVRDGGVFSVNFSVYAQPFVGVRLLGTIQKATGKDPLVVQHGEDHGATFVVTRGTAPVFVSPEIRSGIAPMAYDESVRIPEDDWPFLYLKPGSFPTVYVAVLGIIAVTAWWAVRRIYGREMFATGRFDFVLFLMGAAFMLLETRMVTALSLLFGSTWVVNASVFAGILVTVFVSNRFVAVREPRRLHLWYVPLVASLLATWVVTPGVLNRLSLLERGILGGVIYAIPVAFAGVLFSALLKNAKEPSSALGSNLLGAVIGGLLEYSSMLVGLRSLVLLALVLYLGSYLAAVRSGRLQPAIAPGGGAN